MTTLLNVNRVLYAPPSGNRSPLCQLYFCRHCLSLRDSKCVTHEVDSHFCPNCLENLPSAEAQMKKNRCTSCFDCPSCHHTLSTRATSVPVPDPENPGKVMPKKVYYLACGFCRWTSRDVGIKDQVTASGGWLDVENPHAKRISSLLAYYKQIAQKEKNEKEKKKYMRRRHFTDKYGMSSLTARKRTGLIGIGNLSLKDDDIKIDVIDKCESTDMPEELSDDFFTKPVELSKVTNISQRLANVEFQPEYTSDLYPRHKYLLIKRSQRCRECEHNLSKPEFNPSSIKFKIQLVAIHHAPEIRIMTTNLQVNQPSPVIFTLFNPLDYPTRVKFSQYDDAKGDWTNSKVELPVCDLLLSARDDAAEFDDSQEQQQQFNDDLGVVVFRKANKIGFVMKVTALKSDEVRIAFNISYDYKNLATSLQSEDKQPEEVVLTMPVFVNLGKPKDFNIILAYYYN